MVYVILYILGLMLAFNSSSRFASHVPLNKYSDIFVFFLCLLSFIGFLFFELVMLIIPKLIEKEGHLHTYYTKETAQRLEKFSQITIKNKKDEKQSEY